MQNKKEKIWLLLECFIAVAVPVVWLNMFFQKGSGSMLSSPGVRSLRYYTVLSNLVAGAASWWCLISYAAGRRKAGRAGRPADRPRNRDAGGEPLSRGSFRLRFVGTVMVSTTFLTVLLFFLPIFGWGRLYAGTNFWFHLVIPLASMAGFFLLPGSRRLSFKETLLPILPVLAYGVFYSVNIMINGKGSWPNTNDWYGFLIWGWAVGWCIFAGIAAATWGAGMTVRALWHRICQSNSRQQD